MQSFFHEHFPSFTFLPPPRPDLQPLPNTAPLPPLAACLPPLLYYLAAFLLPPFPSSSKNSNLRFFRKLIAPTRNILALISALLFLRLPLRYHVPFSIGLTYQLALVGTYGAGRVVDAFFISRYGFGHIPRRVKYRDISLEQTKIRPRSTSGRGRLNASPTGIASASTFTATASSTLHAALSPSQGRPVLEYASTVPPSAHPSTLLDRASFALELVLSMRGAGFTWSSADVRHTRRTWRPSPRDRMHSILVRVLPALIAGWAVIRGVYMKYLSPEILSGDRVSIVSDTARRSDFDTLSLPLQLLLTAALGTFLLASFSLGHSLCAIALSPLSPHPLAFFPPLYTLPVWSVTSVRVFWSYAWHRLFSRLFLVYGVWPGEWAAARICDSLHCSHPSIRGAVVDIGKVLGAFASSALVHAFAGWTVLGGRHWAGSGEAVFFMVNGIAVVCEEGFTRAWAKTPINTDTAKDNTPDHNPWHHVLISRIWWISILLYSGRNFARGWVQAGLVREMAMVS